MKHTRTLTLILGLAFVIASVRPAWNKVARARHGRDYATYHYAVAEALDGGDPYRTRALSKRARKDKARRSVHPYFYPPPFLLSMLWAGPLDLHTGYRAFFWINQAALLGTLAVLWRWLRVSPVLLAFVAASFTPITDNAKMGQANVLVLLAMVVGLWKLNGRWVGVAAMAKMSPALYLPIWAARRAWRPVLAAMATAVALSVVTLPLVGFEDQLRFYTEILPGFSSGHYHGLQVRIGLPANHSIPDLFNQLWPGPDQHTLSPEAQGWSKAVGLGLLGALCWIARRGRDVLGDACLYAAVSVLMLIVPVYTYEHHLVMALFPAVVVGAALLKRRLPTWSLAVALPAYFFVAWPLYWLRPAQKAIPALHWVLQESKFFGLVTLGVLATWAVLRSPPAPSPIENGQR